MEGRAVALATALIQRFEGCHLTPYACPANYPTVGWGRLLGPKGADPADYPTISQNTADDWLRKDVEVHMGHVLALTRVPLAPSQLAALTSFVYNLGAGRYECSTLRAVINRGDYAEAPRQFLRWVYAGGRVLRGLQRRREAEVELWLRGMPDVSP